LPRSHDSNIVVVVDVLLWSLSLQ